MSLLRLSRAEWLDSYFSYQPGEHVAAIGPTGSGKTWALWQMLGEAMRQHPGLRVVTLMPKPADPTTARWSKALGLQETREWPPRRRLGQLLDGKPTGHVLWPPHVMSLPPAERRQRVGAILRKGLDDQYRHGSSITFLDDAHSAAVFMGLNEYLEELLVNGRAGGAGAWLALQKPTGSQATGSVSSFAYSSVTHMLLARDTDERNVRRFGEIGGFDPRATEQAVRNLRLYQVGDHAVSELLYLDLRGPYRCLVGPLWDGRDINGSQDRPKFPARDPARPGLRTGRPGAVLHVEL